MEAQGHKLQYMERADTEEDRVKADTMKVDTMKVDTMKADTMKVGMQ
jgi:hypothetical protein